MPLNVYLFKSAKFKRRKKLIIIDSDITRFGENLFHAESLSRALFYILMIIFFLLFNSVLFHLFTMKTKTCRVWEKRNSEGGQRERRSKNGSVVGESSK